MRRRIVTEGDPQPDGPTFITALAAAIDEGAAAGFDADITYDVLRHSMVASRVLEERRDLVMAARTQPPGSAPRTCR